PYATHSWSAPGDYLVSLWCFSDSYPGGISAAVTIHVVTGLHYVAAGSTNSQGPYTSWTTAATNIQDAINVTEPGGQVLVTNGVYAPIKVTNPVPVRSVNGPLLTTIDGGQSNRCVSMVNDASLSGFTLTNGFASYGGGGASGRTLSNCVLIGNSGGGAYGGTLNNCTLSGNSGNFSGGAVSCTLNNCTLSGNSGYDGGGAAYCTLYNCTLSGNS